MIDTQNVQDFEGGFQALLDALDKLRSLSTPSERDGIQGIIKWHDEVKRILSMLPELPDTEALARFAEDTDRALAELEDKTRGAQGGEKAHPRDDGLLPTERYFWAEIVTDAGSGAYTFKEEKREDATTWSDLAGGRTGTCYEANAVAGIVVGTIIKIREEYDTTGTLRYVFNYQRGGVFPVTLSYTAGDPGNETTKCSYVYTVTDTLSGVELGTAVDPTAGVHNWQRPTVGYMLFATFGYAHLNADGDFVIGWINEVADQEACA